MQEILNVRVPLKYQTVIMLNYTVCSAISQHSVGLGP